MYDENTSQYLTEYTYAWRSEGADYGDAEIVKMASFMVTTGGEIIYGDGYEEAWPEIEVLAKKTVKKKVGSKRHRDILSLVEFMDLIPDEEAAIDFVEEVI